MGNKLNIDFISLEFPLLTSQPSDLPEIWLFGLCYAMDGGYKGWRFLSIVFYLERTNQLSLLPDKDLVDLCPLSNHNK